LQLLKRPRRDAKGAAAVEFALVMPVLLLLVFGIIQYGWYFYAMQAGTSATGDALRRLAVDVCTGQTERDNLIKSDLGSALSGSLTTDSVVYKDAAGSGGSPAYTVPQSGGSITLTVSFPTLNMHFPFLPMPNGGTVTRVQTAPVENATVAPGVTCS
jgi:Flp pilus assembly protein TadG